MIFFFFNFNAYVSRLCGSKVKPVLGGSLQVLLSLPFREVTRGLSAAWWINSSNPCIVQGSAVHAHIE